MSDPTPLYVGLDVHKDSIAVAHAQGQSADPPVYVGAIGTRQADLDKLIRRLHAQHEILWVTVEDADPTAAGVGDAAVDVGDDLVLAPEVRFDARLHAAYARDVTARRQARESSLEGLGIVHARMGATDQVLPVMFRMLERQRRRGR